MSERITAQVRLDGTDRTLTYLVPAESKVGDRVRCPVVRGMLAVDLDGQIVGFGDGGYRGPVKRAELIKPHAGLHIHTDAPYHAGMTIGVLMADDGTTLVGLLVGNVRLELSPAEARSMADSLITSAELSEHPLPLDPQYGADLNDHAAIVRAADAWQRRRTS
jgi:hypothetical protein